MSGNPGHHGPQESGQDLAFVTDLPGTAGLLSDGLTQDTGRSHSRAWPLLECKMLVMRLDSVEAEAPREESSRAVCKQVGAGRQRNRARHDHRRRLADVRGI